MSPRDDLPLAESVGIAAFSIEGGKIFSQTNRHIHFLVQNAHHAEIAVIQRPEKQIMTLVTAKVGLTLYIGWHSKPLRKTPPEKMISQRPCKCACSPLR